MSSYKVGQLSALMKSGSPVSEKKKKKAEKLNLLFSTPLPNQKEDNKKLVIGQTRDAAFTLFESSISPIEETVKKRKKRMKTIEEDQTQETKLKLKRKHEKVDPVSSNASNERTEENETHLEEEMVALENNKEKKEKMTKKRRRKDSESSKDDFIKIDDARNARTVFVGNLPMSFNKEDLKSLFRQFGKVESARIRCVASPKETLPKKVAVIRQRYHPNIHSFNGFVVFETKEMALAALELDGTEMQDHHIRVDIANRHREHDHKRSVFVGNLPFDIDDDDLWDFFQEVGDVRQVRIIRDKETRIGKGFGYVLFKTMDAAALALEKNGEEFKGRPVRILRSAKREKKIPRSKLSMEDRNSLFAKKRFQGREAKKQLRVKKNKKIAKNRSRLKRKKIIAEKLQAGLKISSNR